MSRRSKRDRALGRLFFGLGVIYFLFMFSMCQGSTRSLIPKERAYPKVVYLPKEYQDFSFDGCDLSFEVPAYATIKPGSRLPLDDSNTHPCWFDIDMPHFNGTIHCSYAPITVKLPLDSLIEDAFTVVDQVNRRSNYREDIPLHLPNGSGGLLFTFEGPAASQAQFFLTDSVEHFFKASLYFNTRVRPDSIEPISAYIKQDILRMIETFDWSK